MIKPTTDSVTSTSSSQQQLKAGRTSQHYDALVRRLQAMDNGWADTVPLALGVASCVNDQGVTTVSANLAIAAAKVSSGPVLLVDTNVHRPAIGRTFGVRSDHGLMNVLAGERPVFDVVVESPVQNLSLLLEGKSPSQQQRTYDITAIEEMVDNLKHVFHLIVFDLPPAQPLTNCLSFAARLDGLLLVVQAESVPRETALQAYQQLTAVNATVLGAVYNKCRKGVW